MDLLGVVVLVAYLMLPGMSEPIVKKIPMESYSACIAKITEVGDGLKLHNGEAYKYFVGCEVTGSKSDPS